MWAFSSEEVAATRGVADDVSWCCRSTLWHTKLKKYKKYENKIQQLRTA